jgi:hypothetical protein
LCSYLIPRRLLLSLVNLASSAKPESGLISKFGVMVAILSQLPLPVTPFMAFIHRTVASILEAHASAFTPQVSLDCSGALLFPAPIDAFHPPSHFINFLMQFCGEIRFVWCDAGCLAPSVLTPLQRAAEQPGARRPRAKEAECVQWRRRGGRIGLVFGERTQQSRHTGIV